MLGLITGLKAQLLKRLRQKNHKFKACMDKGGGSKSASATK